MFLVFVLSLDILAAPVLSGQKIARQRCLGMLGQGFEPWSSARKANMIGRTTPTERRISDEEWPIDKSVFFGRAAVR